MPLPPATAIVTVNNCAVVMLAGVGVTDTIEELRGALV